MSVSSSTSSISYAGNASTVTAYPVPFVFQNPTDLEVLVADLNGNVTTLALNTGYTVTQNTGSTENTGSITTTSAIPSTSTVTIARVIPYTQLSSFTTGDRLPAATIEQALDKLTMGLQQVGRAIGKCIRGSDANSDVPALPVFPTGSGIWVMTYISGAFQWMLQGPASLGSGSVNPINISTSTSTPWSFAAVVNAVSGFVGNLTGNVTGNLTGNVTGNTAGTHTGNVVGNVTGNLTGNVTGNITGNVAGSTGTFSGNVIGGHFIGDGGGLTGLPTLPTGAVMAFEQSTAPAGFLALNGSTISRTTYAALFSIYGTTYGAGDGSTTFSLPDRRGYFIRGYGTNADGTASGSLGALQADAYASHSHGIYDPGHGHTFSYRVSGGFNSCNGGSQNGVWNGISSNGGGTDGAGTGISIAASGGTETRPRSVALLLCVKY